MNKAIKQISFGKIAEFRNGLNFGKESHGNGCLLVGVPDFKGRFNPDYDSLDEINPEGIVKKDDYLQKGDIVFVRSNGNKALVGRSLYIDKDVKALFSGFCIRARITSDEVSQLFCAYYTKTATFKSQMSSSTGTNINNLNQGILSRVNIPLFPKNIQQKIAAVLSALDTKIDLNNRINAELEAMAKTLYEYWFVQFDFPDKNGKPYKSSGGKMVWNKELKREIPVGWDCGSLSDLGNIVGGSTPSTDDPDNFAVDGTPWITPKDLSNSNCYKFISRGELGITAQGIKNASLKTYPKGTVLLSSRAPIGYMSIARNPVTTNQGFKSFIPNKGYSPHFIYYTIKNTMNIIVQYASGSTFKEISGSVLKTVKVCLPKGAVVDSYTQTVSSIFERQDLLEKENQQLSSLRDWLLPMLMNGQVKVS